MATATTKFITKSDFALWFELSYYLEESKLNPAILNAQISNVKPILNNTTQAAGSNTLYQNLQEYIEASKTPVNANYDTLLGYITPFLVFTTISKFLPFANVYPTNQGFRELNEKNSEPLSEAALAAIASESLARSKTHEKELRDYLCLNASTFYWNEGAVPKFNPGIKIGRVGYSSTRRD